MKPDCTKEEMINMLHNMRFAVLRGLKADATDEEKARMETLLFGGGEDIYMLMEQLMHEPAGSDEEELLELRDQLHASLNEK